MRKPAVELTGAVVVSVYHLASDVGATLMTASAAVQGERVSQRELHRL